MSSLSDRAWLLLATLIAGTAPNVSQAQPLSPIRDLVGVGITRDRKAIVLTTLALPIERIAWRFRALNIEDIPGVTGATLSKSGTKLFVQTDRGPGFVVDLTRHSWSGQHLQYVAPEEPGSAAPDHAHRLPSQRFISLRSGVAHVVDDLGRDLPEYPTREALDAVIEMSNGDTPLEDAIRTGLAMQEVRLPDAEVARAADALRRDVARTPAAAGTDVIKWRFFHVEPQVELYMPVLEMGPMEEAFPSPFRLLEGLHRQLGSREAVTATMLRERYGRMSLDKRRQKCTMYYRTTSAAGSWIIEFWLYYPFDYGGVGSHLHDPEHVFVEVDKLGGAVHLVIGAGHGFLAGNNIYSADRQGASAISLPLFVLVEQAKHASAPDIDRDGVFTPGIDENEYRERAKIWGLRDVIGTMKNELVSYDRTMSAVRHPSGYLAPIGIAAYFPQLTDLAPRACCRLEYLPDPPSTLDPCHEPTEECARRAVTSHPDYRDLRNALKEWVFPRSFLRVTYGAGPRSSLQTLGVGYAFDLDQVRGLGALPGRVGVELFGWRQHVSGRNPYPPMGTDPNLGPDPDACIDDCKRSHGVGYAVRFEQFTTNLFGVFAAARIYQPPHSEFWMTFGPMIEVPLLNKANLTLHPGVAFRAFASPRFEMRVSVGVWKPRTAGFGVRARRG